jgi:hypothetical protein
MSIFQAAVAPTDGSGGNSASPELRKTRGSPCYFSLFGLQ